jgi:hypothetical protein
MAVPTVSCDALLALKTLLRTVPGRAVDVVLQAQHRSSLAAGGADATVRSSHATFATHPVPTACGSPILCPAKTIDVAFHGQAASRVVGEVQSSGSLRRPKDSVLLEQIINDRLLLSVDQPGNTRKKNASGGGIGPWRKRAPSRGAGSRTMSIRPNFQRHNPLQAVSIRQ